MCGSMGTCLSFHLGEREPAWSGLRCYRDVGMNILWIFFVFYRWIVISSRQHQCCVFATIHWVSHRNCCSLSPPCIWLVYENQWCSYNTIIWYTTNVRSCTIKSTDNNMSSEAWSECTLTDWSSCNQLVLPFEQQNPTSLSKPPFEYCNMILYNTLCWVH